MNLIVSKCVCVFPYFQNKLSLSYTMIVIGTDADIFTSILYNHYNAPDGFCFDILCDDFPIIDDRHSTEYNIDKRVS